MAPTPMSCSVEGCDFATPANIPNWELIIKTLEIHSQTCHNVRPNQAPNERTKLEKLPRPTFTLNMSEGEWLFVIMQWNAYISQSPVTPDQKVQQLRAACDQELLHRVYEAGDFTSLTTQGTLLTRMKSLAVKVVHKTLHMMSM